MNQGPKIKEGRDFERVPAGQLRKGDRLFEWDGEPPVVEGFRRVPSGSQMRGPSYQILFRYPGGRQCALHVDSPRSPVKIMPRSKGSGGGGE